MFAGCKFRTLALTLRRRQDVFLRSDAQVVTGKDAASCHGMVCKQLRSVGAPIWLDVMNDQLSEQLGFV